MKRYPCPSSSLLCAWILGATLLPGIARADYTLAWTTQFDGPGNGPDLVHDILVDSAGNAYVTGESRAAGGRTVATTVKYSPDGTLLWSDAYVGPSTGGPERGRLLALGPNDDVYVAGVEAVDGPAFPGPDVFVIRYTSAGTRQWVAHFDGVGQNSDGANDLVVDDAGNAFVAGGTTGAGFNGNMLTLRIDADGTIAWFREFDGPAAGVDDATGIALDGLGGVVTVGRAAADPFFDRDYAIVRYDVDGTFLWSHVIGGPAGDIDEAHDVVCDGDGNVYVTGIYRVTSINSDFGTVKYDSAGAQVWFRQFDSPGVGRDNAQEIRLDPSGNAVVFGTSVIPTVSASTTTVEYAPDGTRLWTHQGPGSLSFPDGNHQLALGPSGDVFTCSSNGMMVVRRLDGATGAQLDEMTLTVDGVQDLAVGLAVTTDESVFLAGDSLRNGVGPDFDYTLAYYELGAVAAPTRDTSGVQLASTPNPFRDRAVLDLTVPHDGEVQVILYDARGRRVRELLSRRLSAGHHRVPVPGDDLGAGVYFAEVRTPSGRTSLRVVHIR
ncbi:MAG: SBBP repeat-containing protein [bacterium]